MNSKLGRKTAFIPPHRSVAEETNPNKSGGGAVPFRSSTLTLKICIFLVVLKRQFELGKYHQNKRENDSQRYCNAMLLIIEMLSRT